MLAKHLFQANTLRCNVLRSISQRRFLFQVRRVISPEELKPVLELLQDIGAIVSEGDEDCFFTADPTGHWVGEVDGEVACHSSFVKYPNNCMVHYCLGATRPAFRNKGFTKEMAKVALKDDTLIPKDYYRRVYVRDDFVFAGGIYGRQSPTWKIQGMVLSALVAEKVLRSSAVFKPVHIGEVDLGALCEYEERIVNLYRRNFLSKWTSLPGREGWAALDSRGNVTGYTVTMPAIKPANCYKVAPLYADSLPIARCLLHSVARYVVEQNSEAKLYMAIPLPNVPSRQMVTQDLGGVLIHEMNLLCFPDEGPTVNVDKLFSLTSMNVG